MLTKDELPECPVATTVQLIGSKWKLLILRNLLMRPILDAMQEWGTNYKKIITCEDFKELG